MIRLSFFTSIINSFILDLLTLELGIIIIILPTDWTEIIFLAAHTTKN